MAPCASLAHSSADPTYLSLPIADTVAPRASFGPPIILVSSRVATKPDPPVRSFFAPNSSIASSVLRALPHHSRLRHNNRLTPTVAALLHTRALAWTAFPCLLGYSRADPLRCCWSQLPVRRVPRSIVAPTRWKWPSASSTAQSSWPQLLSGCLYYCPPASIVGRVTVIGRATLFPYGQDANGQVPPN
jgi:hypothetical protein